MLLCVAVVVGGAEVSEVVEELEALAKKYLRQARPLLTQQHRDDFGTAITGFYMSCNTRIGGL